MSSAIVSLNLPILFRIFSCFWNELFRIGFIPWNFEFWSSLEEKSSQEFSKALTGTTILMLLRFFLMVAWRIPISWVLIVIDSTQILISWKYSSSMKIVEFSSPKSVLGNTATPFIYKMKKKSACGLIFSKGVWEFLGDGILLGAIPSTKYYSQQNHLQQNWEGRKN